MLARYCLDRCAGILHLLIISASVLLTIASPIRAQTESSRVAVASIEIEQWTAGPVDGTSEDSKSVPWHKWLFSPCSGILLEPVYYGEVFSNVKGGMATRGATQYEALLDLPLTVDFEALDLPLPGRFFLLAQNTHGRGLTDDFIGDAQYVSNIDSSDNIMQVTEYWWELSLLDDSLTIRLGKQDINSRFLVVNMAQDYLQSSFGLSPSSINATYPATSMAAALFAQVTPSLELKIGIWNAFGEVGGWGFSNNDLTLTIGEAEYAYALSDGELPGVLDLGGVYRSGGTKDGTALPQGYGWYLQWEQQL